MRDLLKMSGAATSDINHLEAKARSYRRGTDPRCVPVAASESRFPRISGYQDEDMRWWVTHDHNVAAILVSKLAIVYCNE